MNNSGQAQFVYTSPPASSPSSSESLFLRFSSAAEALVLAAILCSILPSIIGKRKRSSFYWRMAVSYVLILLIIVVRFIDFVETNIFRSMSKAHKIRFLLYGLATLEAMFDMSLVALGTEVCLELCSFSLTTRKTWILFSIITAGIPAAFLVLILIIWESKGGFSGVLALALIESILPGLAVILITGLVWWQARRKRLALTEECLVRIKMMLLINVLALLGMLLNLLLYAVDASVVMDDLIDALIKLCVCGGYLLVQPSHPAAQHIFPCLDTTEVGMGPVSSVQPVILQEEGHSRPANMQRGAI